MDDFNDMVEWHKEPLLNMLQKSDQPHGLSPCNPYLNCPPIFFDGHSTQCAQEQITKKSLPASDDIAVTSEDIIEHSSYRSRKQKSTHRVRFAEMCLNKVILFPKVPHDEINNLFYCIDDYRRFRRDAAARELCDIDLSIFQLMLNFPLIVMPLVAVSYLIVTSFFSCIPSYFILGVIHFISWIVRVVDRYLYHLVVTTYQFITALMTLS